MIRNVEKEVHNYQKEDRKMKLRSFGGYIWQRIIVATLNILLFAMPLGGFAQEVSQQNKTPQEQRLEELEKQLKELKEEIQRMKKEEEAKPKTAEEAPPPEVKKKEDKGVLEYLADKVKIGGYGS